MNNAAKVSTMLVKLQLSRGTHTNTHCPLPFSRETLPFSLFQPAMTTVSNSPLCGPIADRSLQTRNNKKMRGDTTGNNVSDNTKSPSVNHAVSMDMLPMLVLSEIGSFASSNSFSEASRATLAAAPEMNFKIDMRKTARRFPRRRLPGLLPIHSLSCGALPTGRVITHITVTNCGRHKQVGDETEG